MAFILVVNPYVPGQVKQDKVMNMGVLTVASALADEVDVKIVDHYSNPTRSISEWFDTDTQVVAFSCSGAESYYTSLIEARKIKLGYPDKVILMGGQHISGLFQSGILPVNEVAVDCFTPGPGEISIGKIVNAVKKREKIPKVVLGEDPRKIYSLNYSLYPDWKNLIPCVEIGRGCNHSCNFCNSENMRKISRYICRDVSEVDREVKTIVDYYVDDTDIFLFGSIFGENTRQTATVLNDLYEFAPRAKYTFNLRTDCQWEKFIDPLEKLKIRSVFFGMESASKSILKKMNKSRNPEHYIERSKMAIKKFSEENIPFFTSFILGYWGENQDTINETKCFIYKNRDCLRAIGVNRFYIYPGTYDFDNVQELSHVYGCKIQYLDELQLYSILRQRDFTGEEIEKICRSIEIDCNDPDYYEKVRSWRFR